MVERLAAADQMAAEFAGVLVDLPSFGSSGGDGAGSASVQKLVDDAVRAREVSDEDLLGALDLLGAKAARRSVG